MGGILIALTLTTNANEKLTTEAAHMPTKLKVWTGRTGERRVYIQARYARDLPRDVARFADGAFFTEGPDGKLHVDGQGEAKRAAAEDVAKLLGVASFSEAVALATK